jgi:hypothetical protein
VQKRQITAEIPARLPQGLRAILLAFFQSLPVVMPDEMHAAPNPRFYGAERAKKVAVICTFYRRADGPSLLRERHAYKRI